MYYCKKYGLGFINYFYQIAKNEVSSIVISWEHDRTNKVIY